MPYLRSRPPSLAIACLWFASLAATAQSPAITEAIVPPTFRVVKLETPMGSQVVATSINNRGRVTGVTLHNQGGQLIPVPFVWDAKGGLVEMKPPTGYIDASAQSINDAGEVVGSLTHPSFGTRGYLWATDGGHPMTMPSNFEVFPELQDRLPLAVGDDARTIAGEGLLATSPAWVFDRSTRQVVELFVGPVVVEGVNRATAVNAAGVVAGTISTRLANGNVRPHTFRYTPGVAGWFLQLLPGPTVPWYAANGSAINDQGDIVGDLFDEHDQSAAFWDAGDTFVDLGRAPGELATIAKAVNEDRWVVGWSPNDHPEGFDTPFLWLDGEFHDLNDLTIGFEDRPGHGSLIYRAYDVNDKGTVLALLLHFWPTLRFEYVVLAQN